MTDRDLNAKLSAIVKLQLIQVEMLKALAAQGLGPYGNSSFTKAEKKFDALQPFICDTFPNARSIPV